MPASLSRTVEAEYGTDTRLTRIRDTAAAGGAWRNFAYDARGNTTNDGNHIFGYDAAEQPTSLSGSSSGSFV